MNPDTPKSLKKACIRDVSDPAVAGPAAVVRGIYSPNNPDFWHRTIRLARQLL
jgi:hypothetical protein